MENQIYLGSRVVRYAAGISPKNVPPSARGILSKATIIKPNLFNFFAFNIRKAIIGQ